MAEMTADPTQIIKHINALIALDFDAIEAYEAAIARLTETTDKMQLERFLADHRRHVIDLTPFVEELGGAAATQADFKQVLTKGKVVLGGLMGDRAVLEAMKSNEDTTSKTYQKATREPGMPRRVRDVIERNSLDEQRHFAWFEARLATATAEHRHYV